MDFISIKKLKFYTKETLKFLNIALMSLGFIIAIVLVKYKPMYEVKIFGEQVGYVQNKNALNESIKNNLESYQSDNIENVELTEAPEYELKLVEKTQEENEDEIIIAVQKEIKELSENEVVLTVNEKTTKKEEELKTNTLEVAKENIINKFDIDTTEAIANVNGIKIASLPVTGVISSRYGENSRIRSSTHTGLDIAAATGTPISVVSEGTVIFADRSGSYGNLVKIDHGNGVETWYAHANKLNVTVGQKVKAGDIIATVGSTGNSTGPHLHFEIRINGVHVNPQKYLYI